MTEVRGWKLVSAVIRATGDDAPRQLGQVLDLAWGYVEGQVTREEMVLGVTGLVDEPEALMEEVDGCVTGFLL